MLRRKKMGRHGSKGSSSPPHPTTLDMAIRHLKIPHPPRLRRRITISRAIIAAALAVVLGVSAGLYIWLQHKTPPTSTTYTGSVEHITIGNVGEYSIFNIIAKEKGFFAQNGLDAEVTEYPSGPPAVADLLAGNNDFAIAADFVAVNYAFTTDQLHILAQASHQYVFSIIARKDRGITKAADLRGKKIGVTKKGAGEYFLGRYLNLNGMTTTDVTEVDLTPVDMSIQLASGQVDAAIIFEPHIYNLKKSLGDTVNILPVHGDRPTVAVVYTSKYVIDNKPEVIRRYMAALTDAQKYLEQHGPETRQLLQRTMSYDTAYVQYLWPKITFSLSLPPSLVQGMQDEAHFLINEHLAPQNEVPNYLDYIYFDGLEAAQPNAVTIVH